MPYAQISRQRTALMGAAALMIFYFHVHPMFFSGVPLLGKLEDALIYLLVPAADVFLLLSSYGLAHRFARGGFSWRSYAARRIGRTYPALFVGNICYGLALRAGWKWILAAELLLAPFFYGFMPQLWFAPTVLAFSLLAPAYYFHIYAPSKRRARTTALAMLVSVALGAALSPWIEADWYYAIFRVPVFLLGFLWGDRAVRGESISQRGLALLAVLMVVGAAACAADLCGWLPDVLPWQRFLLHLAIAPGAAALASLLLGRLERARAGVARALRAVLTFYGRMSLEFYCVQEAIFIAMQYGDFFAPLRARMPVYLPCFALSTLAGWLLKLACDRLTGRVAAR